MCAVCACVCVLWTPGLTREKVCPQTCLESLSPELRGVNVCQCYKCQSQPELPVVFTILRLLRKAVFVVPANVWAIDLCHIRASLIEAFWIHGRDVMW